MNALTVFDPTTTEQLREMLARAHSRLAQLDREPRDRTLTARNYDSAIRTFRSLEYFTPIVFFCNVA